MDDRCAGLATSQRHVERVDDELGLQMVGNRPADDLTIKRSTTTAR
jgi:hypothetical protein